MAEGATPQARTPSAEQHFTEPPPRYSEASLVKKLEELGIGRPSTYASIIEVLQARNYVKIDRKRFVPEDRGRIVTAFLSSYFTRYVEYDFTADLEEQLDDISGGRIDWRAVLREFWRDFKGAVDDTKELRVKDVLDQPGPGELGPHFFPIARRRQGPARLPVLQCGRAAVASSSASSAPSSAARTIRTCRYTKRSWRCRPTTIRRRGRDRRSARDSASTLRSGKTGQRPGRAPMAPTCSWVNPKARTSQSVPRHCRRAYNGRRHNARTGRWQFWRCRANSARIPIPGEPIVCRHRPFRPLRAAWLDLQVDSAGDEDVLVIGMNRAVTLLAEAKGPRSWSLPR